MAAKVIYCMMQSLDGYIAGPDGGPELPPPGAALHQVFNNQMKQIAVSIYGRTMYEIMSAWQTYDSRPEATPVEIDFAEAWRKVPKVVVSTTLKHVGPNARLISSDVENQLRRLKHETEGMIDVSGSILAASVGRMGLIDEYWLFFHPLVLGGGKPFFQQGLPLGLRLIGSESLPEGVQLLKYGAAQS